MKNIAEQENELFDEWQKVRKAFVRDGVACEEAYLASKRKTVFVLKECTRKTDEPGDLRDGLREPYGPGWWKVARIQHGICEMDLPEQERRKFDRSMKMPPSICAFNLDKTGGHSTTDMERLALIAMRDSRFIERQFEIYAPDLTLCGGTFQIFRYVMEHENIPVKETRHANLPWYERRPGQYVVGMKHPADRGRGARSPEDIIKAIEEIYHLPNGS